MTADSATKLASLTGIEVPTGLLIGGEWRPGSAGTLGVTNPASSGVGAQGILVFTYTPTAAAGLAAAPTLITQRMLGSASRQVLVLNASLPPPAVIPISGSTLPFMGVG